MRNTIKTLLAILTSVSLISSVNAGEVSVTGSAKATYSKVSGDTNGLVRKQLPRKGEFLEPEGVVELTFDE